MIPCTLDYLNERTEQILRVLEKNDARYALLTKKADELFGQIETLLMSKGDVEISDGDRCVLREYFESQTISCSIAQRELYRQGYLDCLRLLLSMAAH